MTRIYLGNLSPRVTEDMLRDLLARDGRTVTHVQIKKNATTGKPRGFAFVDLGSPAEAEAAIAAAQGAELEGRAIKAGMAKELTPRSGPRDFGSGYGGGGGGRGGRGRW
jgi:RNA recognition motif-containing protein